jgi:hypothetical protein
VEKHKHQAEKSHTRIGGQMRRSVIVGMTATFVLATANAAPASRAGDFVRGSGTNIFNTEFRIDVASRADGSKPRGRIEFRVPGAPEPFDNEASPTCLRVEGNRATIGGKLERPIQTAAGPVGAVLVGATDSPDAGSPIPDGVTFYPVASPPTFCPPPGIPDDALTEGGIVVRDRTFRPGDRD